MPRLPPADPRYIYCVEVWLISQTGDNGRSFRQLKRFCVSLVRVGKSFSSQSFCPYWLAQGFRIYALPLVRTYFLLISKPPSPRSVNELPADRTSYDIYIYIYRYPQSFPISIGAKNFEQLHVIFLCRRRLQ